MDVIKKLSYSRKFWLAVVAVTQIIVLDAFGMDPALWQTIAAVLVILIGAIAGEDMAEKANKQ